MTRSAEEELCLQILDREGLEVFSTAVVYCLDRGHGRIKAMQWQVIFQDLLISRRFMAQRAELNFYETEKKAQASVNRVSKTLSAELNWLMGYLAFRKICIPSDSADTWIWASAIIRSWSD